MVKSLQVIYLKHKSFWSHGNLFQLPMAVAIFTFALLIQYSTHWYINGYVTGTPVGDLLLDNLPTVNLDFFIIWGSLMLTITVIFLLIANPQRIFFSLKSLGLFIITRSLFVSLTHLGANLNQITLSADTIGFKIYDFLYNAQNDFFFSGHVGIPFLLAFIFWKEKMWRYLFFASSFLFGASMILGHMHYSIDVFAAPFITYSIFVISRRLFKRDFALLAGS